MKKTENECCGCYSMGMPCMGYICPRRNVTRYYCDKCGEETTLYDDHGEELCSDCILEKYKKVCD